MKRKSTLALGYFLSFVVIGIDYFTKILAISHLHLYESESVLPMLNWTLAFNTGSAFSFLHDSGPWHQWLLGGFSACMSIAIVVWMTRVFSNKIEFYALSLILGGAVGNLIDRISHGYVIDFIDVFYKTYHWPVFNIADTAICVGASLLMVQRFFEHRV